MKLLPDSAFARITLLIAGVLIVTLVASVSMFSHYAAKQRARAHVDHMLHLTDQLLLVLQSEGLDVAQTLLRENERYQGFSIQQQPPPAVRNLHLRPMQFALRQEMVNRMGADVDKQMAVGKVPTVWVRSSRTGGHWLGLPLKSGHHGPPLRLVFWLCLIGLLVFASAYLFTRHFTRPLVELANATRFIGRGAEPPPLRAGGPREIRQLGESLYSAAEQQRQLSRDREMMLAGVSHDLRTPLARLRFAAEMLPESDVRAELREGMVHDIEEMDAIIGQFLAFVRDGNDETPMMCDLNAVIMETVDSLNRTGKTIVLHPGRLPAMPLRRVAVQRLIMNLLNNALQHGRPPVEVLSGMQDDKVYIAVRDHGLGIPEFGFQELLRPFSRNDKARSVSGSGLGLAIVDRIARLHGGSLDMRQSADGFEVRVELPVLKYHRQEDVDRYGSTCTETGLERETPPG